MGTLWGGKKIPFVTEGLHVVLIMELGNDLANDMRCITTSNDLLMDSPPPNAARSCKGGYYYLANIKITFLLKGD